MADINETANINEMRWVETPIGINFSLESENVDGFKLEFNRLAESDDDPLSEWLKLSRARGETRESDQVALAMLIDLHHKVDELTRIVKGEQKLRAPLANSCLLSGLNYTHFRLSEPLLVTGARYYARIAMPVFPLRDVALYFVAQSEFVAEKTLMHDRDQKAWDSYVASRERVMIRQMKGR